MVLFSSQSSPRCWMCMAVAFCCWIFAMLCYIPLVLALPPSLTDEEILKLPLLQDFDWKAYCQLYPDLPLNKIDTEVLTKRHFYEFGVAESRLFPKLYPEEPFYSVTKTKFAAFVEFLNKNNFPKEGRTLMVFHIGNIDARNSLEVIINNLNIFQSAITLDSEGKGGIFYLFNVVNALDNLLFERVNTTQFNVAVNTWAATPSDIYTHLRTLTIFHESLMKDFGSIFFLNNGVRGPLLHRTDGLWLKPFHKLLFSNNVGIVGATQSCEVAPHVQTHFFGLRAEVIPLVVKEYNSFRTFEDWPALVRYYEVGLTELIQRSGYNISSLFYNRRLGLEYFTGQCLKGAQIVNDHTVDNPSRWCDISINDVILYKWGGEMLRTNGFVCDQTKQRMKEVLYSLSKDPAPPKSLIIPETLRGGSMYDLFKQFEQELFRDVMLDYEDKQKFSLPDGDRRSRGMKPDKAKLTDKVCLLVRTASLHDVQANASLLNRDVFDGLDNLIRCELRRYNLLFCYDIVP
eukprot:scaffold268_cov210-Ochromonas_danica.AAC.58